MLLHLHRADRAHQVKPESQVHKDHLETQDHQDHPEHLATMELLEDQDHKDHPAHLEIQAQMDPEAMPVHPQLELQQLQATQAHKDRMDLLDHQAHLDQKATTVHPVNQDPKAHLDHQALQAKMEHQATKDHPAPMDPRESQVFAPNIAPWMVAFSSRMAQGVKRIVDRVWHRFAANPNSFLQSQISIQNGHSEMFTIKNSLWSSSIKLSIRIQDKIHFYY